MYRESSGYDLSCGHLAADSLKETHCDVIFVKDKRLKKKKIYENEKMTKKVNIIFRFLQVFYD